MPRANQSRVFSMASPTRSMVILAVCLCLSCGPKPASEPDPDDAHVGGNYKTPQERQYAKFALHFAELLANDDFDTAFSLGSSHFQMDMNAEELAAAETKSRETFGKPLRVFNSPSVNTEPKDLAGPNQRVPGESTLDASLRKMSASRAVGEIPNSVPIEIRKASVQLEIERDPRTIPDFEEQAGMKPEQVTEEDRVVSYLTVVIVEEKGVLGIAHYFHRWPDVWD